MTDGVTLRTARATDAVAWGALRHALWADELTEAEAMDVSEALGDGLRATAILALDGGSRAIGFAEATLRTDYVNGTKHSPVGFLEGWYVTPAWRGRGVGRMLVDAVEAWVRSRGVSEFASDALLDNMTSQAAHRACGFEETERVVYFRKVLA